MSKEVCLVVGKVPKWKIRHVLRFNRATNMKVVRAPSAREAKQTLRACGSKPKRVHTVLISYQESDEWPNANLKLKNAHWHYIQPNGSVTN